MPKRPAFKQQENPDAYHEGDGLDSLVVGGVDAGAERRAYLREQHRRLLESEAAAERTVRVTVPPESAAAAVAQHRTEQERALAKRRRG